MALSKKQIAKIAADNAAFLARTRAAREALNVTVDAKADLLAQAETLSAKAAAAPRYDMATLEGRDAARRAAERHDAELSASLGQSRAQFNRDLARAGRDVAEATDLTTEGY